MVPTYDFPSTSFDFQFPPLSKPALLSTSQSLLDIPDLSRLPSPTWSLDDNAADIMPADLKGKKHQIEEVEDKTSKTKPHKKIVASTAKSAAKKPKKTTVKKEVKSGMSHGCKPGAAGYSEKEIMKLFLLIQHHLPIGGTRWDLMMGQYNRWAKKNVIEHVRLCKQSLKQYI